MYFSLTYPAPYPESASLSALIVCNAMNWPVGVAISFLHGLHHWLKLCTLGQYIVNVHWCRNSDGFLTFGIQFKRLDGMSQWGSRISEWLAIICLFTKTWNEWYFPACPSDLPNTYYGLFCRRVLVSWWKTSNPETHPGVTSTWGTWCGRTSPP